MKYKYLKEECSAVCGSVGMHEDPTVLLLKEIDEQGMQYPRTQEDARGHTEETKKKSDREREMINN
jgi:hypothetical protein